MSRGCVSLRVAETSDVRAVAELHRSTALVAFAEIFPPDAPLPDRMSLIDDWTAQIASTPTAAAACFVAEIDGAIIGVVVAGPSPGDSANGHLSRLYVDPAHWGSGIGRTLYDRAMAHLRAQGFRSATLWVLEANLRARGWYERLGWRITRDRLTTYAPAGIDDVGYERLL